MSASSEDRAAPATAVPDEVDVLVVGAGIGGAAAGVALHRAGIDVRGETLPRLARPVQP